MKKMPIDQFCQLKYISNVTFSPRGKHLCFTVTEADKAHNRYNSYLYTLQKGKPRQLTSFGRESGFQFLDEDTLLFPGNREEREAHSRESRFYTLSLTGGEAVKAFTFPLPVKALLPLPGGDYLVAGGTLPGWEDLYRGEKKLLEKYRQSVRENEDYEVVDQVPWWWNGGSNTRSEYTALYRLDPRRNSVTRLTEEGFDVRNVKLSRDKSEVWFFGRKVTPLLSREAGTGLYRMRLSDGKREMVAENSDSFLMRDFDFGESFMLLVASDRHLGRGTDPDFYKLSYDDHSICLYKRYGESIGSSIGSDVRYGGGTSLKMEGDVCYFISTVFDSACLFKLEDGEITCLTDREGSVDCFDVCSGEVRCVALYDMKAQEIYDGRGRQLTRFNEKALAGKYVAVPERLNFVRDGHEVHGFVLKPADYQPGKKYPVVFDIHGGPKTAYGPVFYHEMQYWANLGYFVIYCNPTGSDGRGAFSDLRGKYGTVDYEDLMAFCDKALETYPDMDERNVFETGGSYGGFMTNWIIGHTDRFAACVSQRSISNWISFYGISDIGVDFGGDQCQGTPWSDPEKLWWHSPLKYADRCVTPTLFIHAYEDYRCPIDQGYQMFTGLIAHGVESKMVLFKGENHELSRSGKPLHRIRRLEEITRWFEQHKR